MLDSLVGHDDAGLFLFQSACRGFESYVLSDERLLEERSDADVVLGLFREGVGLHARERWKERPSSLSESQLALLCLLTFF